MSWGDRVREVSEELYDEFAELMKAIGEFIHPGPGHLQDPEVYLDLWEFFSENGLEDLADEVLDYAVYYVERWESITGYKFDWELERWRDPETGRFVRDPYHDERWVNDPDVWAEFAY